MMIDIPDYAYKATAFDSKAEARKAADLEYKENLDTDQAYPVLIEGIWVVRVHSGRETFYV